MKIDFSEIWRASETFIQISQPGFVPAFFVWPPWQLSYERRLFGGVGL
jgi:hypothetical protein